MAGRCMVSTSVCRATTRRCFSTCESRQGRIAGSACMTTGSLPLAAGAGHLTVALRQCGLLSDGSVREVAVESSRDTLISHIIRLHLSYDGEAAAAPRSVILKIARADRVDKFWFVGHYEVAFYRD